MLNATGNLRVMCDTDQSVPIQTLDHINLVGNNKEVVIIGSREVRGSIRLGESWLRHVYGRVFNLLVQILLLPHISNTQYGFKIFSNNVAEVIFSNIECGGWSCQLRKKRYRSYKGQMGKIAPNLLNRQFQAMRPNQKWATDVTEFKVLGKRVYLSPILDLFNGEVVSYSVSQSPSFAATMEMLKKAFEQLPEKLDLSCIQTKDGSIK